MSEIDQRPHESIGRKYESEEFAYVGILAISRFVKICKLVGRFGDLKDFRSCARISKASDELRQGASIGWLAEVTKLPPYTSSYAITSPLTARISCPPAVALAYLPFKTAPRSHRPTPLTVPRSAPPTSARCKPSSPSSNPSFMPLRSSMEMPSNRIRLSVPSSPACAMPLAWTRWQRAM